MRALPWFLLIALAASAAPAAPADIENNLVFLRQNGETITYPATSFAWCAPYFEPDVMAPSLHVITYGPDLTNQRYWRLGAVLADVVIGEPRLFPNVWTWPNPDSVSIYAGDPPNQTATFTEEAAGWIIFQQLDCTEGGVVEFTIDARFGSMLAEGPWIDVAGSFRATVTASPFVPARRSTWGAVKATYR